MRQMLGRARRRFRRPPPPESALVVPVPMADPLIERARAAHGLPTRMDVHAHITLLYPFAPLDALDATTERAVGVVLQRFEQFPFALVDVGRFPGNLHLIPRPAEPFVRMTEALAAAWPEYPPYGGAFDAIVPHVTMVETEGPPGMEETVRPELPVRAVAEHVELLVHDRSSEWLTRTRFPLAG
jgi:2'-5' RNA ligase superfamily protein